MLLLQHPVVHTAEMEEEEMRVDMIVTAFDSVETGAPALAAGHDSRLGVSGGKISVMSLRKKRTGRIDLALQVQMLRHIHSQAGDSGLYADGVQIFGKTYSERRIHGQELVHIGAYCKVIAVHHALGAVGNTADTAFVGLYDFPRNPLVNNRVGTPAEIRCFLVLAVEKNVKIFPAEKTAVVVHPFAQEKLVIPDHRDSADSLHL